MLSLPEVRGHRLAVIDGGMDDDQPAIVFLHGLLASVDVWLPLMPDVIRHQRRWYSLSLPAHHPGSCSPWPQSVDFSMPGLIEVFAAALQVISPQRPVELVGWSTGGFLSLCLAAELPERVAGVACICGFAKGRWHGGLGLLQRLARRGSAGRWMAHQALALLAANGWWYGMLLKRQLLKRSSQPLGMSIRATLASQRAALPKHDLRRIAQWIGILRRTDIRGKLAQITAPVSILAGLQDRIISAAHTREVAQGIPHVDLHLLNDAGHFVFMDQPAYYERWLTEWLASGAKRPVSAAERPAPHTKPSTDQQSSDPAQRWAATIKAARMKESRRCSLPEFA